VPAQGAGLRGAPLPGQAGRRTRPHHRARPPHARWRARVVAYGISPASARGAPSARASLLSAVDSCAIA
jgi:hypothetical protein